MHALGITGALYRALRSPNPIREPPWLDRPLHAQRQEMEGRGDNIALGGCALGDAKGASASCAGIAT